MTANPLDLIEARAQAATSGPWRLWADTSDPENKRGASVESAWSHDADGCNTEMITDYCSPADAVFIAAARTDVPKLVAALRAVERLGQHADETHAELPKPHGPMAKGYDMAIRDVRVAIREALGG